ncbi:dipeptidyl peptidase III [Purpureocillium lavendulum]|uniref:Dipeptidyl peptidase III n=1 Tax=Purpureocillium lavendulum TaxID=1247861 RepID=A0AB34G4D4_9HYPO|nr:dipeptidyl peptidase III [Purpureocillium lavendulum]
MTTLAPTETTAPGDAASIPTYELRGEPKEPDIRASCGFVQRPISVTLDGTSIFTLALTLILLIHFLDSHVAQLLVSLVPLLLAIHNDYQNFINLGPGGTPSTFQGYLRITWLRLWAIRDPYSAPGPDPSRVIAGQGILARQRLPYRAGPRPLVAGIAPQRQVDQHGSMPCYLSLRRAMKRLSAHSPLKFGTERSCLEKHGLALFARHPLQTNCQGEICHVHDSDHSMHMCLHPDDIRELLSKGWGQRHPLARKGWLLQMPVSQDFVMVYAPRDEHELQITYKIVEAAIWYILAERVELAALSK